MRIDERHANRYSVTMPEKSETSENEVAQSITVPEAASRLGVTDRTVLNWIEKGYFPGTTRISPTGPYRIPIPAIEQFEKNRQVS